MVGQPQIIETPMSGFFHLEIYQNPKDSDSTWRTLNSVSWEEQDYDKVLKKMKDLKYQWETTMFPDRQMRIVSETTEKGEKKITVVG